ncbi:hypothetical protein KDX16_06065 [Burkholderia vietnamiensis]|uniref:hypothetical protein n=1 Tax=Burkholderia vietnamiensis TaxID=60552 RepID=UPI000ADC28DD|nr:hypothetical protein [Burkholderia vietnamiensis]MBR7915406.1 hypothetical protein [Burkholderia vietnamiensis]HDR9057155.1 hypothetical protein [Burkholderia vietnamiensis]
MGHTALYKTLRLGDAQYNRLVKTPDDLENWLSSSPFGTAPDKGRTLEKQQAAFEAALAATGN